MTAESIFTLPKLLPRDGAIQRVAGFLSRLPLEKAWRVSVQEQRRTRSLAQNAYLHGVAYKILSDATGYELDEIAEFLCGTYFGWKDKRVPKTPRNPEGVESVPIRTTTRNDAGKRDVLKTTEFSDYVAFVQRFAADKGLYIPDPEGAL
jgi:hypothetical protein